MTLSELDTLMGLIIGASVTGMVASALWIYRDRPPAPLPVPPDDEPFRPLDDLRLLRICDHCRRYLGGDRTLVNGQHLSLLHVLCPHCAKLRALLTEASPKLISPPGCSRNGEE